MPSHRIATEGRIVVVPMEHVASIHAPPIAAQRGVWALLSDVRGRLYTGLVPDSGFSIGFDEAGSDAVIHVVPRRAGDKVELPECGEWIADDGVLAQRDRVGSEHNATAAARRLFDRS